jgi:glucan phosphorylase
VLAGDLLKEASDRRLPLVAVGLLYRRGYFHQRLDPSGWQHEYWTVATPEQLPLERALDPKGAPVDVEVPIGSHRVRARAWRADVGRVPLYLLDTDLPENGAIDRFISAQLYVGDPQYRLMQYALLGIGAVRLLASLGLRPAVWHLNEGHPALAALELVRAGLARGEPLERAADGARRSLVFTTHTPVAAGNETYPPGDVQRTLAAYLEEIGPAAQDLLALGRSAGDRDGGPFGMTDLALRTSRSANGVSRRHGEVARAMWAHPRDEGAKRMVQAIFSLKLQPSASARVVFLEDYDLSAARTLVAGCDVWVNLPRPPLEASGTSGMKAALNGGLNLSVLDGWWAEAFDGPNGWGIRSATGLDERAQDARDAAAFYDLLEREVVPLFHDRGEAGLPRRWLERVRSSLKSLAPAFNATRALGDYVDRVYRPAEGFPADR